jgi:MFS family permease
MPGFEEEEELRADNVDGSAHEDQYVTKRSALPVRQMSILCFACFSEQYTSPLTITDEFRVAFNSTPSYLYFMVEHFGIAHKKSDIGFYLGLITTAFLASQSIMNPFWGWTSDRIGRKPVVLLGTFGTMLGFFLFGFSKNYTMVRF